MNLKAYSHQKQNEAQISDLILFKIAFCSKFGPFLGLEKILEARVLMSLEEAAV